MVMDFWLKFLSRLKYFLLIHDHHVDIVLSIHLDYQVPTT